MAANMQQMNGAAPIRRPQHQQLSQLIYSQIITHQVPPAPWHASVSVPQRVSNATTIITNSFHAMPSAESNQILSSGLAYEREAFSTSPDKNTYEARITLRINEAFKKRQANEATMQNNLTAQAAAQAQNQTQMMMNPNMQMRSMGQPLPQGFPHIPQQMQNPQLHQQGQPTIGMNPNGLPMNSNQQAMQMGTQMRPQMSIQASIANLSPPERIKVNQLAIGKLNSLSEAQQVQLRSMLQQRYGPQLVPQAHGQGENADPLLYYFQSQILQSMAKSQGGVSQPAMPMQYHPQRPMNQPVQQLPTAPNGEFGPFANVESIMNQQKAGLMAQEAGQMVVPASNGAGRNATPQPMGSLPGSNPGVGQPTLPHQLPQQFNHPPSQQLKMDQRAAQSQVQIRAQAQAKQMHPQPGGLSGPGGVSQSPAMNTLNAPVRRAPMGVGQTEGHPQMNPNTIPFGQQMMDPRFHQTAQRTPAATNSNVNRNLLLQNIFAQMPQETRTQIMNMPQEKIPELILRWNNAQNGGQNTGHPQSQMGQMGPSNPVAQPMGQFAQGNPNGGQPPNMGVNMNQQAQLMVQQQQINKMRNANTPQLPLDRNALMDNMNVPPRYLAQLRTSLQPIAVMPDLKKWGQVKQWIAQKNVPQPLIKNMLDIQNAQYQNYIKNNQMLAGTNPQLPQANVPQHGGLPNGQATPQIGQPSPNMAVSNPNITVTQQDIQHAKRFEKFKHMSDDDIRQVLLQVKLKKAQEQRAANAVAAAARMAVPHVTQPPQQSHTPAVAGGAIGGVVGSAPGAAPGGVAPTPSQPANEAPVPPRQPNAGHEVNSTSPATQARNIKQPQNGRPAQTGAVGSMPKNGTKRPMSDDAADLPVTSKDPAQRPQPGVSSAQSQVPNLGPDKIAAMTPEQRQKYEAMMKNRQSTSTTQMSEEMMRLQTIGREQHLAAAKETLPDIPMTPEQYRETAQKIQLVSLEMDKIKKVLVRWYTVSKDDNRASLFFKMRVRLAKQFVDGEKMTILKDKFSITMADLDHARGLLESIAKEVTAHFGQNMRKNPSQQSGAEVAAPQGGPARPGNPTPQQTPLNAVNLEKQTQALNKMNQRSNSRAGQPPPAPTTAQPPFPFGAQSPDGQPTYAGKPTVTQDNLQLPARKRPKIGTAPNPGVSNSNASPQVSIRSSPDMNKRQQAAEPRPAPEVPQTPQFPCPDQYCEFHSLGFPTEEARRKHMDDEHFKPAADPIKFAADGFVEVIRPDANGGKARTLPTAGDNLQLPADTSKQMPGTQLGRTDLANSGGPGMKRPGGTMVAKPSKLAKTEKAATPKHEQGMGPLDGVTPITMASLIPAPSMASWEPQGTTIDPQELLSTVTGLDVGANGAILDMTLYRSAITPKDTPESSNGTGSENNSDVSDGVALNVTLDMGFDTWEPFGGGLDIVNPDLGVADSMNNVLYRDLSWDDVHTDFDKPFVFNSNLFSLDTST